ncbi:MAG: NAD(P)/FAD-dependent oxidoreductase [Bacilli bacterium]|nr:NAD(P)/FAD-dependent oxidoreductase [Bacilli bacterium]
MYDVIIIGSGISGATIARELSRFQLKTIILEKEYDVAMEATMANSAIVHSGHDPIPGTLKAKFNILGNRMYKQMSEELDIPYMACGGMVTAINEDQVHLIEELYERALINGLRSDEVKIIDQETVRSLEPNIADGVIKALHLPTTAVTFPWEAAIANIENAMDNGVELALENKVIKIEKLDRFVVTTDKSVYEAKVVINATGVYGTDVAKLVTNPHFEIRPRRGEYYVLDKDVRLVNSVIYPAPSEKGKGVIVTPQYHGNTLLGPTSEYVAFSEISKTTASGLEYIKENVAQTVQNIPYHKIVRSFAGGRATSSTEDFVIEESEVKGFINVCGIESPGLTAAPAFAKYVVEELVSVHFEMKPNTDYNPRRRKVLRTNELTFDELNNSFHDNQKYGRIICRCEKITEGEIVDAINRNCGARSVVGVKNRVRAGAGRCQGGFCQSEVINILARELKVDKLDIVYNKAGSNILKETTKGEQK